MGISVVGINKANLMEVIMDDSVYVIKKKWCGDGFQMIPVKSADVKDLMSEDVLIVRITN